MVMSLLTPAGILLVAIGTLLLGNSLKSHIWPFSIGIVLIVFSFLFPATLGYYPLLFGIAGFLILTFFFAVFWYWAKNHNNLQEKAKAASVYQLISYIFFLLIALLMCTILGNPFSGLYFPKKVIELNALPFHYSFGTKAVVYIVLAMFFYISEPIQKVANNDVIRFKFSNSKNFNSSAIIENSLNPFAEWTAFVRVYNFLK
jgi:hypothetical protein